MITMIAAMDKNRVIGVNNQLPWHLKADLQHFKALTLQKPIIMGRKTFESIGKPLPKRRNIVITRQAEFHADGCEVVQSLEAALQLAKGTEEIMIIGGASLYTLALPIAQRLYLTIIDHAYAGDAYFPAWQESEWQITATSNEYDATQALHYRFVTYDRIA